jgi:ribosomal protein L29
MPSSPDPLVDERFAELAALLRDARPRTPERLREHVRELAAVRTVTPKARRLPRVPRRALVLAPALLVAAGLAAGIGVLASRSPSGEGAREQAAAGRATTTTVFEAAKVPTVAGAEDAQRSAVPHRALPPARTRAQEYRAELRVRVGGVGELSSTTSHALRITRSLGGFVVSASYDAPGDGDGDSVLVVRVPVRRVQDAIFQFSQLGTIVAQRISIADLQGQLNRQTDAIAALRRTIARLETQLEDSSLTPEERERLQVRLLEARRALDGRLAGRAATNRRAATARVALTLTTREDSEPAPPPRPGDFEQTLRDAASVLAAILTWLLAGLIVLSPALVLGVLAAALLRIRRRTLERRLLERPAS